MLNILKRKQKEKEEKRREVEKDLGLEKLERELKELNMTYLEKLNNYSNLVEIKTA